MKTKPDCVCREMKTGPWGDLLGKRALDRNGTRKVLGLLLWLSHIVLVCAADEAESISSLLMDGYSLHVYPQCAAQPACLSSYMYRRHKLGISWSISST